MDRVLQQVDPIDFDCSAVGRSGDRGLTYPNLPQADRACARESRHAGSKDQCDESTFLSNTGGPVSFEDCAPKRSTALAEIPLLGEKLTRPSASSIVTSTKKTSWRDLAFVRICSLHDHHQVRTLPQLSLGEFRDRHFRHREDRCGRSCTAACSADHNRIAANSPACGSFGPLRSLSRSPIALQRRPCWSRSRNKPRLPEGRAIGPCNSVCRQCTGGHTVLAISPIVAKVDRL